MEADATGTQQRINERLFRYWEELRDQHAMPLEQEVDINVIGEIWASCFLVKYQGNDTSMQERFSYLHLGSNIVTAYGDDASQRDVCEALIYPSNQALNASFQSVINDGQPIHKEAEFTNKAGLHIKYRSIMLPLADDATNRQATYILGGMRWKSYL